MNLGFIGIGIMGEPMSENLLKKTGYVMTVFDMNPAQIDVLVAKGAGAGKSAKDVVEKSDIVFSMLPKDEYVKSVYESVMSSVKEHQIFIDMSTISPRVSQDIAEKLKSKGASMLDAPVVKSKAAAINGTLGIYVGGDYDVFEKVKDMLLCIGNNVIYLGNNGKGLVMKLIHNMLVGQIQNGVNEMIVLAQKVGIDIGDFVKAISYGGGQNFYLDAKGKAISEENFETAFSIENMHKDVHLAYELIVSLGLNLPVTKHVLSMYDKAMAEGIGSQDFSASYKIVKKESGLNA